MTHDSLKSDSCLRRWARPGRLASVCQSYHGGVDSEPELASDARLGLLAQNTLRDPIVHQGKAEVMKFFQGYEHAAAAREFLSVDGGAFMIEVKHGVPHSRMGIQMCSSPAHASFRRVRQRI